MPPSFLTEMDTRQYIGKRCLVYQDLGNRTGCESDSWEGEATIRSINGTAALQDGTVLVNAKVAFDGETDTYFRQIAIDDIFSSEAR